MIMDSNPIIYQYIKGQQKSRETAVMRITETLSKLFYSVFDIVDIRKVAREFLSFKESEYKKGHITIKSIY